MKEENRYIDLMELMKSFLSNKKLFIKVWAITFVISCAYILSFPRYYSTSLKLAPEAENMSSGGSLGALASSFGINLGNIQSSDAISPILYPDLMEDNSFIHKIFHIRVKNLEGDLSCSYYDYLRYHMKLPWWGYIKVWILEQLPKAEDDIQNNLRSKENPYIFNKKQDAIAMMIRDNISISVDKKTDVISISVVDQDKLICKTIADSVKLLLQDYITDYRTNKARIDEEYYRKLVSDAKHDYDKARQQYAVFSDANMNIKLESYKAKLTDMENEMQLKFNTYTTLMTQYQIARAKVQERTPAFSLLVGPAVPIKPAGPKRMLFVLGMLVMATFGTMGYLAKDILFPAIRKKDVI